MNTNSIPTASEGTGYFCGQRALSTDNGLGLAEMHMEVFYLELINLRNYLYPAKHIILCQWCLHYLLLYVSWPPLQLGWGHVIKLWSMGDKQRSSEPGPYKYSGILHLSVPLPRGLYRTHAPESELPR